VVGCNDSRVQGPRTYAWWNGRSGKATREIYAIQLASNHVTRLLSPGT
jgi:hypothetical protein